MKSDETELFLTEDGLKNSSAKMVSVGDILYALYGATSGEVGISQINGAINQAILAIKPIDGYSSYFIMQWLKLQKQKIIDKYLQGGQGNLSGSIVKNLILNVPNFEEQQKIGSFFKKLDDTIALQKRKTALTKRIYLGILQKLFSNYSLKKYKRYKLKDVSISKKGKEIKKNEIFKTGKYAVVHYADLYKFYPVQKNAIHFSNKKLGILIPNNSLLFPGSDVTPSGLARTSTILQKNVFAGNDVIIFCLNENKVSAQFLSYELNFLKEEILSLITGTTIKHIYIKDLENMDIFLPSMKVQKLIENVLNKITYKRISNKNIIFQLSKFKQFLLQNMFI